MEKIVLNKDDFKNFNQVLTHWGTERPDVPAYIYLGIGDTKSEEISFKELYHNAKKISFYLNQSFPNSKSVLLLFQSPFEFIQAFFGCMLAGKAAIPMFPPKANQKLNRLLLICKNADTTGILTSKSISQKVKESLLENHITDIEVRDLESSLQVDQYYESDTIDGESIAFLQYTSGSTGQPKGVIVTHNNLLDNERVVKASFGHSDKTIFAGWLPFFHDMGIVGNMLQPFYLGVTCVLLAPEGFLQKPIRWLKAISDYKATTAGAPNFAYDLCVKRIADADLDGLDLRSWTVAFNGAEPIKSETIRNFSEKFKKCGFKEESFYPCYGMAETTLIITGGDHSKKPVEVFVDEGKLGVLQEVNLLRPDDKNSKSLIGCGRTWNKNRVLIVDPDTRTKLQDGTIGEIWVQGNSVAKGYWKNDHETNATFRAELKDIKKEGEFLRTGDLGFILDNELYITGRIKEMIIIRGKNYYPQDIEWVVEKAHPSLAKHGNAAFSIEKNQMEQLVVIQEIERTWLRNIRAVEIKELIRQTVAEEFQLAVYDIILVKPFAVPKTSSNKIQRIKAKSEYLNNGFEDLETSVEDKVLNENTKIF